MIELSAAEWIKCGRAQLERQDLSHYATLERRQVKRLFSCAELNAYIILIYYYLEMRTEHAQMCPLRFRLARAKLQS